MTFDTRTAFLLLGVMCVTASLGVYAALRVQLRRGHLWWCVSGAAFGVSCLLVGLRHAIPDVLSFVVANSCLVGALTGQAAALIEERGRRVGLRWPALLTILFAVGYTSVRIPDPSYGQGYTLVILVIVHVVLIGLALDLWRRGRQAGSAVMALAFAFLLVGLAVRLWFLPGSWSRGGPLEPATSQMVLLVGGFMSVILSHVGYLGLQFDRMSAERVASEREAAMQAERARQTALREADLRELVEERNQLIRRLARSEAAQDLVNFATSLPHELSQPLCASQLNLETLAARLEAQDADVATLGAVRSIESNNERVQRMLQQLRILLRAQEESGRETLDLCVVVDRTLPVMQSAFLDAGSVLESWMPDGPILLQASQTQLQQALLILCTQVLDAIRAAGPAAAASCVVRVQPPSADGELCCLCVEGPPLAAIATSDRRDVGLAIAHRIAQAHQGHLEIPSPGSFRLWLPAAPPR